jgi:hypothetical protein
MPILAQVAQVLCRFRAIQNSIEDGKRDCDHGADDRHYDEQFD